MRLAFCLLCLILLGAYCTPALAGSITQLPKTNNSYSFASDYDAGGPMFIGTADDFVGDGQTIQTIRWWGSCWQTANGNSVSVYSDGLHGASTAGITGFGITLMGHSGPTPTMPFGHPDSVGLASFSVPIAAVTQSQAFTVTKSTSPLVTEDIWEYSVDLSNPLVTRAGLLAPQSGTRYWLRIIANLDDVNRQWGWHEGDGHWGDYACQTVQGSGVGWYIPCGGHDMAFEITTVPEPGSLLALSSGLIGLVGLACRSRRRRAVL